MTRSQKPSGRASSMPVGLMTGAAASMGITLLGSAVIAKLMDAEKMDENMIGYAVMVMLLTASCAGALISRKRIKHQHLLVCGLTGVLYFLMLMSITALFFGGQYEAVGVTAGLILAGSMLPLLAGNRCQRKEKRRMSVRVNR